MNEAKGGALAPPLTKASGKIQKVSRRFWTFYFMARWNQQCPSTRSVRPASDQASSSSGGNGAAAGGMGQIPADFREMAANTIRPTHQNKMPMSLPSNSSSGIIVRASGTIGA